MIRILQVLDSMDMGGIQTFIMNVYRHLNREEYQFDFLVFRMHKQVFDVEITSLGGIIYKIPGRKEGLKKHKNALKKFFDEHPEYKIIHYNTSSLSNIEVLKEAKKHNVSNRIIHSHSTNASGGTIHNILHTFNKKRICKLATNYLACGEEAGQWFFEGTKVKDCYVIVNNGIDCRQYEYSKETRNRIRKELYIDNSFVVGHVGRFSEVKNHVFTLKVFDNLCKKHADLNPMLLLIGEGELREDMIDLTHQLQIENNVKFLGVRHDVSDILQAMDVMIMPSIYEGFPVTLIEAQAAGLPCVISNTITSKSLIKSNVVMVGLSAGVDEWTNQLINNNKRELDNKQLIQQGFDITETVNNLIKIYLREDKE